MKSRSLNRCPR